MKSVTVKSSTYSDYDKKNNDKDPKINVGDHVSKYKKIFAIGYVANLSEEVFVIKKVKNTVSWTNYISDLDDEEVARTFYKK